MKNKEEILLSLQKIKPVLLDHGIIKIGLFGSHLNNNKRSKSDIDLLIDFERKEETFDNFISVCEILESTFKDQKLDIVTKNGLSKHLSKYILEEVKYA